MNNLLQPQQATKIFQYVKTSLLLSLFYICLLSLNECRNDELLLFNRGVCPKKPEPIYGVSYSLLDYTQVLMQEETNKWFRIYFILPCKDHIALGLIFIGALIDAITLPAVLTYLVVNSALTLIGKWLPVVVFCVLESFVKLTKKVMCYIFNLQPRVENVQQEDVNAQARNQIPLIKEENLIPRDDNIQLEVDNLQPEPVRFQMDVHLQPDHQNAQPEASNSLLGTQLRNNIEEAVKREVRQALLNRKTLRIRSQSVAQRVLTDQHSIASRPVTRSKARGIPKDLLSEESEQVVRTSRNQLQGRQGRDPSISQDSVIRTAAARGSRRIN